MSKIEVQVRFLKEKTKEEEKEWKEFIETEKIIKGDDFNPSDYEEESEKYMYDRAVFDLKDIIRLNNYNEDHVVVRFYGGDSFVVKINYDKFVEIYSSLTGYNITSFIETK